MNEPHENRHAGPIDALMRFFDAMEKWEGEARVTYKKIESGQMDLKTGAELVRAALERVFVSNLAKKPLASRFSPSRIRFGSNAPKYGRAHESVLTCDLSDKIATIQTTHKGPPRLTLIYTLIATDDGWRLQDNRRRLRADGTTTAWDL